MTADRPPLIGITERTVGAAELIGIPPQLSTKTLTGQLTDYARCVRAAGGVPVHVSDNADARALADRLDGVIIAGGNDVDPRLYGGVPGPVSTLIDPAADAFEIALTHAVIARSAPLLGICRGMQLLNVALGGSLHDDLPLGTGQSHAFYGYPPTHRAHRVRLDDASALQTIYGGTDVYVNSLHHQCVHDPGTGVRIVGRADDGVPEAIEVVGTSALGVQWHPELLGGADPIFHWLVTTAASPRQEGTPWTLDTMAASQS